MNDRAAPGGTSADRSASAQPSYPWFDWLRFLLASIVVLDHSGFKILPFLSGTLAVEVFFALSGWLIGGILLRSEKKDLPHFFFNRATRIWIPYAFAVVLIYVVAAAKEGIDFFWIKYLILDVTFTHQLFTFFPQALYELPLDGSGNQFWSIAVEEQFYLLAPIAMFFLPIGKTLRTWGPLAILLVLLNLHAGPISLGVCAAILQRSHNIAARPQVRIGAAIAAILCAGLMWKTGSSYIAAPVFALAVVLFTAVPGRRSELALIAGGLSYPLYLNQWIGSFAVNFVSNRWLPLGHAAHVTLTYLNSVLMALLLYWLIDRQIQNRRSGWYSPALGRRLAILAYTQVTIGLIAGMALHHFGPHAIVPVEAQAPQAHSAK